MDAAKVKTFWERPEGLTGKIFLGMMLAGAAFGVYTFLPALLGFVIVTMTNTLHAAFLLGAVGSVAVVATDRRVHNMVRYGYQGSMRGITKLFVQIDPLSIAQTYVEEMSDNLRNIGVQRGKLSGKMQELNALIEKNDKERETNLKLAQRAQSTGGTNEMISLKTRKAGVLRDSNMTLQNLYKKMSLVAAVLKKIEENTAVIIESVQFDITVKKSELDALKSSSNAFRSALKIINGDPDRKYMFDVAMETIVTDISLKKGEMEHFMEITGNVMQSIDLQNGILEEDGLKQLDEWIKGGSSALLGTDKTVLIESNPKAGVELLSSSPPKLDRHENKYSKMLESQT